MKWILLIFFCAATPAQEHLNVPPAHIEKITIPADRMESAKTKAELIEELRLSIYEDSENIYNPKREKHIQELARKLRILP